MTLTDQAKQKMAKQGESRELARSVWASEKVARVLFSTCAVAVGLYFISALVAESLRWQEVVPDFPIDRSVWNVTPDHTRCDELGKTSCLVEAITWIDSNETVPLFAPEGRGLVKIENGPLWISAKIPRSEFARAASFEANQFILGWIKGNFRVWINGEFFASFDDKDLNPKVLSIPMSILMNDSDLEILFHLWPRMGASNLVPLTASLKEGFATYATATNYRNFHDFLNKSKSLAMFSIYFLFSVFFFLLWRLNRKYREYLHLSFLALFTSVPEILFQDGLSLKLPSYLNYEIYHCLLFLKCMVALNLSFAFARLSSSLIQKITAGISLVAIITAVSFSSDTLALWRLPLNQYLVSLVYLLGAMVCLRQVKVLRKANQNAGFLLRRFSQLYGFSGVFLAMAIVIFLQYSPLFEGLVGKILWNVPELVLVLFLGAIALIDYKNQIEMIERIPLSEYHKLPSLPEMIAGHLLILDLKNSEAFFRNALKDKSAEFAVPSILSHLWNAIASRGGIVLRAEGDEIIAFFDRAKGLDLATVFSALEECNRNIALASAQYEILGQNNSEVPASIRFRGAITLGEIRPIWIGSGSDRLPGWSQLGDSMVFVDAARLMEIEKSLEMIDSRNKSLVLVKTSEIPVELRQMAQFLFHDLIVFGKHKNNFKVSVYEPKDNPQKQKSIGLKAA